MRIKAPFLLAKAGGTTAALMLQGWRGTKLSTCMQWIHTTPAVLVRYQVIDIVCSVPVSKPLTRQRARKLADLLDQNYGAIRYAVKKVGS